MLSEKFVHIFSVFWKFTIACGGTKENANLDTVLFLQIKVFLLLMIIKHVSQGLGVLFFQLRVKIFRDGLTITSL